jgi:C-methyltransferase
MPSTTTKKIPPARLVRLIEHARHHVYRLHQRLAPAPVAMADLLLGAWVSQAIHAAAKLRLADALKAGPLRLDDLAARVGADPDALSRLMRALISRGIFRQHRDGRYDLTPLADTLRVDAPVSRAAQALLIGSAQHREHWSLLAESVTTGRPSVPQLRGKEFFDYLADDAEYAKLFNEAITSLSGTAEAAIVAGYDFNPFPTIVDVGGGHGGMLATILAATPTIHGVLYDQPHVVTGAPTLLKQRGVDQRVRIEQGSFFDNVPAGGDAYVLKNIIHDWPDEQAAAILGNVRAAAHAGATVLLIELVLPDHDRDFLGKWSDLEMLLVLGSRERTKAQYRNILRNNGFRTTRVVSTASPFSIVEATAA